MLRPTSKFLKTYATLPPPMSSPRRNSRQTYLSHLGDLVYENPAKVSSVLASPSFSDAFKGFSSLDLEATFGDQMPVALSPEICQPCGNNGVFCICTWNKDVVISSKQGGVRLLHPLDIFFMAIRC